MARVVAKLILLALLAYAGVSFWYARFEKSLLQEPVTAKMEETSRSPVEKTEIVRPPNDYSVIITRNIFQAAVTKQDMQKEPVIVEQKKAPEPTKLKLTLMGTISGDKQDSRAIISDDAKRQQDIYQVGDSIQGGIIKSIERGRVVLSVNKRDEILSLADRQGGGPAYQPSPSDFYQEPVEDSPEPVAAPEDIEDDGGGPPEMQIEPAPVQRPPQVRPRPIRRSMNLRQRRDTDADANPSPDGR